MGRREGDAIRREKVTHVHKHTRGRAFRHAHRNFACLAWLRAPNCGGRYKTEAPEYHKTLRKTGSACATYEPPRKVTIQVSKQLHIGTGSVAEA